MTPKGPNKGTTGKSSTYSTIGAVSETGDPVEYQFDWNGDGTALSPWGSPSQSQTWTSASIHYVRARARSSNDPNIVSDWSDAISVSVTEKPFFRVGSPQGGETHLVGTAQSISWTSGYLDPDGTIYLFYWYDKAWHPIAALPSSATSYDWIIPDTPPGLESVIPSSRIKSTSIWIGSWVNGAWECWASSGSFRILYDEWVFTISGQDKGGAAIRFDESKFGGHGISFEWGMFEIEGDYDIHADGVIEGSYIARDLQSGMLGSGRLSGTVNSQMTTMKLTLNKPDNEPLFNMSGVRSLSEPEVPAIWTAKISGSAKGSSDLLKIEPYHAGEETYSRVFRITGTESIPSLGTTDIEGYFFLTNGTGSKGSMAYGIYATTGAISETGVFSGNLNPNTGKFKFNKVSDDGKKYTLSGQVAAP